MSTTYDAVARLRKRIRAFSEVTESDNEADIAEIMEQLLELVEQVWRKGLIP